MQNDKQIPLPLNPVSEIIKMHNNLVISVDLLHKKIDMLLNQQGGQEIVETKNKPRQNLTMREYKDAIMSIMEPGISMHYVDMHRVINLRKTTFKDFGEVGVNKACTALVEDGRLSKVKRGRYIMAAGANVTLAKNDGAHSVQ